MHFPSVGMMTVKYIPMEVVIVNNIRKLLIVIQKSYRILDILKYTWI